MQNSNSIYPTLVLGGVEGKWISDPENPMLMPPSIDSLITVRGVPDVMKVTGYTSKEDVIYLLVESTSEPDLKTEVSGLDVVRPEDFNVRRDYESHVMAVKPGTVVGPGGRLVPGAVLNEDGTIDDTRVYHLNVNERKCPGGFSNFDPSNRVCATECKIARQCYARQSGTNLALVIAEKSQPKRRAASNSTSTPDVPVSRVNPFRPGMPQRDVFEAILLISRENADKDDLELSSEEIIEKIRAMNSGNMQCISKKDEVGTVWWTLVEGNANPAFAKQLGDRMKPYHGLFYDKYDKSVPTANRLRHYRWLINPKKIVEVSKSLGG